MLFIIKCFIFFYNRERERESREYILHILLIILQLVDYYFFFFLLNYNEVNSIVKQLHCAKVINLDKVQMKLIQMNIFFNTFTAHTKHMILINIFVYIKPYIFKN